MADKLSPAVNPSEPALRRCDVAGTVGEGVFLAVKLLSKPVRSKACVSAQGAGQRPATESTVVLVKTHHKDNNQLTSDYSVSAGLEKSEKNFTHHSLKAPR